MQVNCGRRETLQNAVGTLETSSLIAPGKPTNRLANHRLETIRQLGMRTDGDDSPLLSFFGSTASGKHQDIELLQNIRTHIKGPQVMRRQIRSRMLLCSGKRE